MVTSIVCSSVARKSGVAEVEGDPVSALMPTVLAKPVLDVASPVVGLKLLPPADKVIRIFEMLAVLPSVDTTLSWEMMRSRITSISSAVVPVMLMS